LSSPPPRYIWPTDRSTTFKFIRNADSQTPIPDPLSGNLHFSKIHRLFINTLMFEKHYFRRCLDNTVVIGSKSCCSLKIMSCFWRLFWGDLISKTWLYWALTVCQE
jgi:hypothetical protein